MNPIAIVSAMHDELSKVLELMPDEQKQIRAGREFWLGHLHNQAVVVVLSGIGKVAAATTATLLIEHFGVDRILFTGVAGALGQDVKIGDMVIADSFLHHDLDASPLFPRYEIPGYGTSTLKADENLTHQLVQACNYVLTHLPSDMDAGVIETFSLQSPQLHQGLVVSGDCFVSSARASQQLQTELPLALAVEMEGAAFAQVCHDYGIPFAAVRTMSDKADDEATLDFTRFLAEVASHFSMRVVDRWLFSLNTAP